MGLVAWVAVLSKAGEEPVAVPDHQLPLAVAPVHGSVNHSGPPLAQLRGQLVHARQVDVGTVNCGTAAVNSIRGVVCGMKALVRRLWDVAARTLQGIASEAFRPLEGTGEEHGQGQQHGGGRHAWRV